jgi:hypothetical protein
MELLTFYSQKYYLTSKQISQEKPRTRIEAYKGRRFCELIWKTLLAAHPDIGTSVPYPQKKVNICMALGHGHDFNFVFFFSLAVLSGACGDGGAWLAWPPLLFFSPISRACAVIMDLGLLGRQQPPVKKNALNRPTGGWAHQLPSCRVRHSILD